MFFGNKYVSKAMSSVLLVALLLIHSVKLLHSHPNNSFCSKDTHSHSVVKNSSDCSVCAYQLVKDADDQAYFPHNACIPGESFIHLQLGSFYNSSFYSAFESRGPPSGI